MKTNSRLINYLLLGLFMASFVTSLLSPVAAAVPASQMTPTEAAKSWLYFNALGACIDKASAGGFLIDNKSLVDSYSRIKAPNAQSGQWFANPKSGAVNPTIGYFLNGKGLSVGGDVVGCGGNNTNWIADATKLWGYTSPIEALCDFGFKRENGTDCNAGSDWFTKGDTSLDRFRNAVKNKVYGGADPSLSTAARYVLYRDAFYSGCIGSAAPTPYTGQANDGFTYTITTVDASGVKADTRYYSGNAKSKTDKIWFFVSPQLRNVEDTCGNIASEINKMADAYANYVQTNPDQAKKDQQLNTPPPGGDATTCKVEAVGWIICPVLKFMSLIVDGAYGYISSLLTVQPLLTTGGPGGSNVYGSLYGAWSIMRNFANVAFVIAFLIIIFSQLTSVGITNYGVKKMLPRIIVAAILVNVSYWISAIAVDLSNIVGSSAKDLFSSLINNVSGAQPGVLSDTQTGGGWGGLAGGILAGTLVTAGVSLYVGLSALLPALLAALLAVVTVFLVLTLRQALIILLVVIAPLAFVAYLLPNTESLFKKWRSLFQTLLLMYPIIAIIFGASAFASTIVMTSASGEYKIIIQIMGALISVLPLALTPMVMKTAGSALGKFGAFINNPNRGPVGRMKKGAEGYRKNRQDYRKLKSMNGGRVMPGVGWNSRRRARREAVLNNRKAELNRANTDYIASAVENNDVSASQRALGRVSRGRLGGEGLKDQMAAGGGEGAGMMALAQAINQKKTLETQNVTAAKAVIENLNLPFDQLKSLAQGANVAGLSGQDAGTRRAAIQMALGKSTVSDAEEIIKSSGNMTNAQRQDIADGLVSSGLTNKATHLGGKVLDDIAQGRVTSDADLDNAVAYHFNKGKFSAEALVSQDGKAIERIVRVAEQGSSPDGTVIDLRQKVTVAENADKILSDNRLNSRISSKEAAAGINTMAGR